MRKFKKTTMALFSALTIFSTSVFAAELIAENYVLVYPNANLTTPYSGRYIDVGERFSIVEEAENAYRVNYYASSGAPREGWVKKSILNSKPASNNSNPELIAKGYVDVYSDSGLTSKYPGRYIDVGERFSIVQEVGNAYKVNYYASNGDPRVGWVSKSILGGTSSSNNSTPVVNNTPAAPANPIITPVTRPATDTSTTASNSKSEFIAKSYVDVYSDSGLTSKYPGRYIDVGERFSIVQEVGNAYKVNYYASNGADRTGWVSKSILGGANSAGTNNTAPVAVTTKTNNELIAQNYVDVYADQNLVSKYAGRYIAVGERFSIVQETGSAYKVNYYASNGDARTGWVSKSVLGGGNSAGTNNTAHVAVTTKTNSELIAQNYVDVYADQSLVSKYAGRYIAAGERFSIVQETGTAYKVNYYASNGDSRVGWVSKSILGGANSSGTSQTGANNTVNTGSGSTVNNNELVAKNYVDVYADQNLVSKYMGRYIDVGEKFSIVQETIGSYKVNYYASNGAPRTGWVSKSILGGTSVSTNNAVLSNPLITQVARPTTSGTTTSANNELIAQNYVDVYADQNLVSKYTGRFIDVGERFSIIQETIGAYKVNYYASNGAARQGWVKKIILGTTATNTNNNERNTTVPNGLLVNPLITPVGRTTTSAGNNSLTVVKNEELIAKHFEEVYADYGLNNKYANRFIAVGEKFSIVEERDNAYQVNYYANNGAPRTGWVSKSILDENNVSSANTNSELSWLISQWNGKSWEPYGNYDLLKKGDLYWPNGETAIGAECFGFSNYIFEQLKGSPCGTNVGHTHIVSNLYPGVKEIYSSDNINYAVLDSLFANDVKPGDFIQGTNDIGKQHSMIFVSYDRNAHKVKVFHANFSSKNYIDIKDFDLVNDKSSGFLKRFTKVSIYTK